MELAKGKYAGFNDSHLTEKLVEVEKMAVRRETVRRILRHPSCEVQRRGARKYWARRECNARMGTMVS